ncbi:magnesium transporter CorA family protein [Paenibacillus sp. CF384]|uniref:magnesium transporter CorA family protein n=1 Tax=Paenibacillus sp. CF384 TaxID=1884382 RepID=UPI00089B7989|nr:magnesium transporter CorA family protein [Paenibacillus sp. CF384]SDX74949.1 Mg2+ and Co2+ transporter CorA [Paenibacillus sp. CF384]
MMHRMLQFPQAWEWLMLHEQRPAGTSGLSRSSKAAADDALSEAPATAAELAAELAHAKQAVIQAHPELAGWIHDVEVVAHNQIIVSELPGGDAILHGTLLFQVSEDESDILPLHFRITDRKLVTYMSDMRLSVRLQLDPWQDKLNRCQSAPEGFFVLLGAVLETFHDGLDRFETRLGDLEQKMRKSNRTGLMNVIFERRYELLHWSHLFIPVKEIQGAAREAFMHTLLEQEEFKRMELKLDRIQGLLSHYAMEIDTLLMMDDAISNFRGNDIMKTLTIFTALFMPATVIGAVWGMNFKDIPWASERWGFITVSLVIVVTTILIYWWLWHKGWTGDLLTGRHKGDRAGSSGGEDLALVGGDDAPLSRRSRGGRVSAAATGAVRSADAAGSGVEHDAPLPARGRR